MSLKEFKHEDITRITHVTKPVTSKIDDDEYQQVKTLMNYAPIKMGGFKEQPYLNWRYH